LRKKRKGSAQETGAIAGKKRSQTEPSESRPERPLRGTGRGGGVEDKRGASKEGTGTMDVLGKQRLTFKNRGSISVRKKEREFGQKID